MTRVICSPSLTFLQPPADDRRRLGGDSVRLLKLLSAFAGEHPIDFCARLLREEARRVLNLPPLTCQGRAAAARLAHNQEVAGSNPAPATNTPRAKRGPGRAGCLRLLSRGPPD